MKNAKHTPGPWTLKLTERCTYEIVNDDKIFITEMNDTELPDARLIAAAPELFEALVETLSCIDQHTDDAVLAPIIEQAKQAIAKARGES